MSMSGLYHYQGMPLYYMSEDREYVVYRREPKNSDKREDYFNPFKVYKLEQKWSESRGWYLSHKYIDHFADLMSAVYTIRDIINNCGVYKR